MLNKAPPLSLGLRLGEGSGAALAIQVLKGAIACKESNLTKAIQIELLNDGQILDELDQHAFHVLQIGR